MRLDAGLPPGRGVSDNAPWPAGTHRLVRRARRAVKHGFSNQGLATRQRHLPSWITRPAMAPTGLEAVYLDNRDGLLRFLRARGAGEAAEDLVHDLWLKVRGRTDGPIAQPLAYLYRAADLLMIDRYRSARQAERRDQAWQDGRHDPAGAVPTPEREVAARQEAARVTQLLRTLGTRKATVFRRARLDGVPHRTIAADLGISLSTVEADLREVTRALAALRGTMR